MAAETGFHFRLSRSRRYKGIMPEGDTTQTRTAATARFGTGFLRDIWYFAALSGVRTMIETRPLDDVQAAYDRMLSGQARFRMVLTTGQ